MMDLNFSGKGGIMSPTAENKKNNRKEED